MWRHKFNILDSSQLADWGFYRESRLTIAKVTKAAAAAAKSTGDAGDGGEGELQRFYCKHVMLTDVPDAAAPERARSGGRVGEGERASRSLERWGRRPSREAR